MDKINKYYQVVNKFMVKVLRILTIFFLGYMCVLIALYGVALIWVEFERLF